MIILIINILVFAFTVATVVRCVKDKIRRKPLFIILILFLLHFGVQNIDGNVRFMTGFWFGVRINNTSVTIPAGAVIYWGIRKRIIKNAAAANAALSQEKESIGLCPETREGDERGAGKKMKRRRFLHRYRPRNQRGVSFMLRSRRRALKGAKDSGLKI